MQGKSVQQAQVDIDTRYQEISYRQFIDPPFRVAGRPKMRFVYLYTAPGKNTITKTWQHKKAGGSVRPPQSKEVHSFHVFAVPGTPRIALMFQETAKHDEAESIWSQQFQLSVRSNFIWSVHLAPWRISGR